MYFIYEDRNGNKNISIAIDGTTVIARKLIHNRPFTISKECTDISKLGRLMDNLVKLDNEFWQPVIHYKITQIAEELRCRHCNELLTSSFGHMYCPLCGEQED